jgi:hypothetical protein
MCHNLFPCPGEVSARLDLIILISWEPTRKRNPCLNNTKSAKFDAENQGSALFLKIQESHWCGQGKSDPVFRQANKQAEQMIMYLTEVQ